MPTDAELMQSQIENPTSSEGIFELPCGYVDKEGNLHTEVSVREITGVEEDMLASQSMPTNKKINELITRCVQRLGDITERAAIQRAVLDLPVGDRVFLMFAVRRATLGDEYPFNDTCPECGYQNLYVLDLGDLEVKPMDDPKKRLYEVNLPSGKKAVYKTMTGRDEMRLDKVSRANDSLSQSILIRLESLNGSPASLDSVKSLGMRDRNFLRDQFEETEGGVDTTMEMTCPACGHEFDRELDIGQAGFFFPSSTLKTSKKKSSI